MLNNYFDNRIISINKPLGWTSFDVVAFARNKLGIKKIGHCGTLDPLASGLLLIATNKATKSIESLQSLSKSYLATFCLGATTQSLDTEFWPSEFKNLEVIKDNKDITLENIQLVIKENFIGTIMQIPPQYSAVNVGGKRAYKSARKGVVIQIPEREVEIIKFKVKNLKVIKPSDLPYLAPLLIPYQKNPSWLTDNQIPESQKDYRLITFEAEIICSKGTYIRSLIKDLADKLNTIGYMIALKRTAIGDYSLSDALDLASLVTAQENVQSDSSGDCQDLKN